MPCRVKTLKAVLLFVSVYWFHGSSCGQSSTIDSLKRTLRSEKTTVTRADLHNRISWAYYEANNDSALYYAQKALFFSTRHKQAEQLIVSRLQLAEISRSQDPEGAAEQLALAEKQIRSGNHASSFIRLLLFKGNLAMSTSRLSEARTWYRKGYARAPKTNPLHAEFCLNLARLEQVHEHVGMAKNYLEEAFSSAQTAGNHSAATTACNNLGNLYAQRQQYDQARRYYQKSLQLAVCYADLPAQSRAYLNTGNLSYFEGHWTTAIEYYIKSARLKEQLHDKAGIALIHNNIAAIYKEQRRFRESLRYFLKSSRYYEAIGDSVMLAESWVNVAIVKIFLKKPRAGLVLLHKALELLRHRDQPETVLITHINIAFAYSEMGKHRLALNELAISEKAAREQDDRHSMAFIENLYGASYYFLGNYPQAKIHYTGSYELGKELGLLNEQQKALFGLYETAEKTGDYVRALDWFETYNRVKDSLFNTETSSRLAELQEQYGAGQKQQEINNLSAKNKAILLKNKLTANQLKLSLLTVAIVLLIVALLIVFFYQRTRRQRSLLSHTQEMNKERINQLISQQEIVTLEAAVLAQQSERKKLAKDIHDNIGNFLATLKYQHEANRPAREDDEQFTHYATTSELIAAACKEVRVISHQMATGESFDFHLMTAIRQLVSRIASTRQFTLHFNPLTEELNIPREAELVLYKIIQELLSNVLKHAQASVVILQINQSDDDITLLLEDNGRGFNTAAGTVSGIGLKNIRDRVEQLGGTLDINSRLQHGTTVVVFLPLFQDIAYDQNNDR